MGCQITDLFIKKSVGIKDLAGKVIAIDAHLFLYQFLTSIRQPNGSLLMDSRGNVTSHLTGLFARTIKLMEYGLKLIYVFDGKAPLLKAKVRERRKEIKIKAQRDYEKAAEKEDVEEMRKYAARTTRLTPEMIAESKKLLDALGIPFITAPSEGEAQAAFMVKNNDAYCVASQDIDALMFGSSRLVRNLSLIGKRKVSNKLTYETYNPELIDLTENLNNLGIDQNQLIVLSMLVGTDFNPGGIKGIGQKGALKIVKKYGTNFDALFNEVKWDQLNSVSWLEVYETIKKIPVSKDYSLKWRPILFDNVLSMLVNDHDFSEERVMKVLNKFEKDKETRNQKGLGEYF